MNKERILKNSILVSILVGIMITFFQNCGSVKFGDGEASVSGKLAAVELDAGEQNMVDVDPADTSNDESGVIVQPGDIADDKKKDPPKGNPNYVENENEEEVDVDGAAGDLVACILEAPGKSLKLGLVDTKLEGVNGVSRSVCVTRKGCLELVAAKFDVKGAYSRGYCAHNPNVVRLSDAQLVDLLK